jgi:hypothetical protein
MGSHGIIALVAIIIAGNAVIAGLVLAAAVAWRRKV